MCECVWVCVCVCVYAHALVYYLIQLDFKLLSRAYYSFTAFDFKDSHMCKAHQLKQCNNANNNIMLINNKKTINKTANVIRLQYAGPQVHISLNVLHVYQLKYTQRNVLTK